MFAQVSLAYGFSEPYPSIRTLRAHPGVSHQCQTVLKTHLVFKLTRIFLTVVHCVICFSAMHEDDVSVFPFQKPTRCPHVLFFSSGLDYRLALSVPDNSAAFFKVSFVVFLAVATAVHASVCIGLEHIVHLRDWPFFV